MRLDMDQLLRQSLPTQDYEYFAKHSIVVPSRPHLAHREGHFDKCGGAGLSYWLFSDPQNPNTTALRRRLLMLLFGDPKTTVAHGTLHGIRTVFFQTQELQNRLVMSDHPFPADLQTLDHWLVAFDNLPFEMNTHMLFVLLVHGFGFPSHSILNICHEYDVLNQNHISATERATPRTVVMFSTPEPVLLCLHYKRQLTKSIASLFPAECVPDFLPTRDDTYTIAISSPNMGNGPLPPLPSLARIGECPTLCISRTELLTLCQDPTAVPLRATPTVPLGALASAQPTTPTRGSAPTSRTPTGLSQYSALDTMSSWRSPLAEVTAPPRASSPRKRRTEDDLLDTQPICTPPHAAPPSSSVLDAPVSGTPTMEECIAVFQGQALSQPGTAANLVGWSHQIAQLAIKANLLDSTQHGQVLLAAYAEHTKLNMQSDFQQVDDGLMDQSTDGKE